MKTIYHLVVILFLSIPVLSYAQDTPPCGSDVVMEQELSNNPLFARQLANLERRLIRDRELPTQRDGDICVIPTVVHIIHTGEPVGSGTNISNEQIFSAITALNEDFRKIAGSNGDGDGADVGIEFCLATRDPNDNSTNGIMRVDGSSVPNYADEGISVGDGGADEETVKALSRWPKEDYCNIWIVNEINNNDGGSGIQGFAYFPTPSLVDGITILYNAFGTVGNLKPYTNLNRTATHEAGHYLGLYHTFHSSLDCEETNCETQGDRICDTPVTIQNTSCNNPACSSTQQVENYMDYTGGACADMFTEGQKVRMRYTLFESRGTILDSQGCIPPTALDAAISSIESPVGSSCSSTIYPQVTLSSLGGTPLTSVTINYGVDNDTPLQFEWTGNLNTGESQVVNLPALTPGTGNHTFFAYTSEPNGSPDEYELNDGYQSNFVISFGANATIIIDLDYAGTETSWQIMQGDQLMAEGGGYQDNDPGFVSHSVCLSEGCYDFIMLDDYGDGLGFLSGSYEVLDGDGEQVIYETNTSNNNFGFSASHEFCMSAPEGSAPVSSFTASTTAECAGQAISFTDTSTGDPAFWSWQFEGGTPAISSWQNPQDIVYETPGTYAVTLSTSNNFGSDTETITGYITIQDAPIISVSTTNVSCNGISDGSAQVTNPSGTSISWSSGGSGNSVNGLSPGNHSVTVSSTSGCFTTETFTITEPAPLNLSVFKSDVSCYNMADGSATATASGGTAPYSFDWSNGDSGGNLSGLDQGIYSAVVTDANGCETAEDIAIIQPSELVINTGTITPETCLGADGSATVNAMGGTGSLTYAWSSGFKGQYLSNVAFGIYEVTVTDDSGCSETESVTIPYDCDAVVPTTQLVSADCNSADISLSQVIMCNEVPDADMYLWSFSDAAGTTLEEAYTIGNNNTFMLSDLTYIGYGETIGVKIKVQKDNEWGEWGNICNITTMSELDPVDIIDADCNAELHALGTEIQAESNSGAEEFEWTFMYGDNVQTAYTYVNTLVLGEDLDLIMGEPVTVTIRARYGDSWSLPGNQCTFVVDIADSVDDLSMRGEAALTIYPNPNNGDYFSLDLENLPKGNSVIHVTVYNSGGKRISDWTKNTYNNTQISETYSFNNKLSKGMYLIQVDLAGYLYQQKLIVK